MHCLYAMLAETVNETKEGKLNILGVFDRLWVKTLPAKHRQLFLVAGLEAVFADVGEHEVRLQVVEAGTDTEVMSPVDLPPLQIKPRGPGRPPRARLILQLNDFPLHRLGLFEIRLRIDGNLVAAIPLEVDQVGEVG